VCGSCRRSLPTQALGAAWAALTPQLLNSCKVPDPGCSQVHTERGPKVASPRDPLKSHVLIRVDQGKGRKDRRHTVELVKRLLWMRCRSARSLPARLLRGSMASRNGSLGIQCRLRPNEVLQGRAERSAVLCFNRPKGLRCRLPRLRRAVVRSLRRVALWGEFFEASSLLNYAHVVLAQVEAGIRWA
jgi:hypothetical protein